MNVEDKSGLKQGILDRIANSVWELVGRALLLTLLLSFVGCDGNSKQIPQAQDRTSRQQASNNKGAQGRARNRKPKRPAIPSRWVPTLSKSEPIKDVVYPNVSWTELKEDEAWLRVCERGIEHFLNRNAISSPRSDKFREVFQQILKLDLTGGFEDQVLALNTQMQNLVNSDALRKDPFCRHMWLKLLGANREFQWGIQNLDSVRDAYSRADYPAFFHVLAMADKKRYQIQQAAIRERLPVGTQSREKEAILYWLTEDFRLEPKEHRVAWRLLEPFFASRPPTPNSTILAVVENTQVHPWIRFMAQGVLFSSDGSAALNKSGLSNSEKQKIAKDLFRKSDGYFEKALQLNPTCPEAATGIAKNASLVGDERRFRQWLKRATEIQFDYLPAYEIGIAYHHPQFGGDAIKLMEFGKECFETKRFDTRVPAILMECWLVAFERTPGEKQDRAWMSMVKSKEMKQMLADCAKGMVEQNESHRVRSDYYPTCLALFRTIKGDYAGAKEVHATMKERQLDPALVKKVDRFNNSVFKRSIDFAIDSEYKDEVIRAVTLLRQYQYEPLIAAQPIVEDWQVNDFPVAARPSIEVAKSMVADFKKFESFEPVKMTFRKDLADWCPYDEIRSKFIDQNTVELSTIVGKNSIDYISKSKFLGPKSFEVEITPKEWAGRISRNNSWGIVVGAVQGRSFFVGYSPPENRIIFGRDDLLPAQYYQLNAVEDKTFKLKVNSFYQYFEVYFNDTFVFRSSPETFGPALSFLLTNPDPEVSVGRAQFSNLVVRKLSDYSPPISADFDLIARYYSDWIDKDPKAFDPHLWLGIFAHRAGRYQLCIDELKTAIDLGSDIVQPIYYIGDSLERLGKTNEAIDWYAKAAATGGVKKMVANPTWNPTSNITDSFFDHVRFRLAWLQMAHADRYSDKQHPMSMDGLRFTGVLKSEWAAARCDAQLMALEGDLDGAIEILESIATQIPAEYSEVVDAQLSAYKKGQLYQIDRGDKFYLDSMMKKHVTFHEETLPEKWREFYR